jgi:hypothetical protein
MTRSPFPIFALIAVIAVGFVDYATQSQKAGSSFGAYPVGSYVAGVKSRVIEAREKVKAEREKSRQQSVLAKMHLPQAPEGWERRAWEPALNDRFTDGTENDLEQEVLGGMDESAPMLALNKVMNDKQRAAARDEVWEYVGPEGTIRLSAEYLPHAGRILSEKIALDPRASGVVVRHGVPVTFGTIRGVRYYFAKRDLYDSSGTYPGAAPIFLIAAMGRDIKLSAFAETEPEVLVHLLESIDYDALNAMMDTPLTTVGQAAPGLSDDDRQALVVATYTAMSEHLARKQDLTAKEAGMLKKAKELSSGAKNQSEETSLIARLLSAAKGEQTDTGAGGVAKPPQDEAPKRLKLSGGRECLAGGAGSFCDN